MAPQGDRHQSPFRIPPGRTDRAGWEPTTERRRTRMGTSPPSPQRALKCLMPLAESCCPAPSTGWKGKCPLLSPQRDTKTRDKGSLPGRAFRPCFAQWPQGPRRPGRGSRKRGTRAGFVHRPLAASEDGACCSRVHPMSGEPEPWEVHRAHCALPCPPPRHPPGLPGPSSPTGSQHGAVGEGPAWTGSGLQPQAAQGTEGDPAVSARAPPSLTCHPRRIDPSPPPGVHTLARPHGLRGGPPAPAGAVRKDRWGFPALALRLK